MQRSLPRALSLHLTALLHLIVAEVKLGHQGVGEVVHGLLPRPAATPLLVDFLRDPVVVAQAAVGASGAGALPPDVLKQFRQAVRCCGVGRGSREAVILPHAQELVPVPPGGPPLAVPLRASVVGADAVHSGQGGTPLAVVGHALAAMLVGGLKDV